MTQVNRTAAYIRKDATPHGQGRAATPPLPPDADPTEAQLWSLLGTANTVESLVNALDDDPAIDIPTRELRIENALRRWLDEELIELATDS